MLFEGIFLFVKPSILRAERTSNLRKYPFLKTLIENDRNSILLFNDEKIYNAKFVDYASPKEVKQIEIEIFYPKQAKRQAYSEKRLIHLAQIKEVKSMKR